MTVLKHLARGYRVVYAWFWGLVALVFTGLMVSLTIFGPWVVGTGESSAWGLVAGQAPAWFLFTMGIMLATTGLPVAVANGVTRREYTVAAGIFTVVSSVLFGLLILVGHALEILVYRANGIMAALTEPYPAPTLATFGRGVLQHLAFMVTGYLIGLCFYRLRVWWAIAVTPVAMIPVFAGNDQADVTRFGGVWLVLAVACAAGVAAYLLARSVPIRSKKA
ncbi:hypothetical protein [Allorhizocola rhizosphaerae]|uniref:hypothetical protein n=1 Tax=Allorhizocola rhizosphaerae TaxID=1872709 RepID=UPI000E3DCDC8|nr:hypothetical protein [Allorhizocola rhizosphaerae]